MIDQMTGQMNFSRECNTLYVASSPRAKSRTLSQLLWLFSMYQSAFLCEYISSNVYFMLSNQQTGSTDQSQGFFSHFQDKKLSLRLPPFARCFLTRSSWNIWSPSALQARRRIPASFTIPASLLYCPISQSGLTSFV